MKLPTEVASEIRRRMDYYRLHASSALSQDGKALRIDGSHGFDCWISPDGDVYMETYEPGNEQERVIDRSPRAQHLVLALGAKTIPQLEALLPSRPLAAADCPKCKGIGRTPLETRGFVCFHCGGLGWLEPA